MRITKLVLQGFKSFADRTEISFPDGITMIVGPNGCGKSNISDAVRWVLGEQNVRNLRGERSQDVIFSGAASRQPKNAAEVTMVLDNVGRELPLDTAEVSVTRRVLRNGDSEFYINKRACRLRDIQELFANTGLGRGSLAIIGQNRVDRILSARPEERRLIFEEVAGISRYRMRKEDGLAKLRRTEENTNRVKDLVAVLTEQAEPMAKAAEKARALKSYMMEKRALSATESLQRLASVRRISERISAEVSDFRDAKQAAETKISLLDTERVKIEETLAGIGESYRKFAEAAASAEREEAQIRGDYRVKEAELSHLREEMTRLSELAADERQNVSDLAADIEEAAEDLQAAERELASRTKALAEAEAEKETARQAASVAEAAYRAKLEEAQEKRILRERAERDATFAESEKTRLTALLAEETESVSQAEKEMKAGRTALSALEKETAAAKEEAARLDAEGAKAARALKGAAERSFSLMTRRNTVKSDLAQLISHRNYLLQSEKEQASFSNASRAVLRADEAWSDGVIGAFGELIRVPAEFTDAAEAAMGGMVSHIVTDTQETAGDIIRWMKRTNAGRTTFYPLDAMKPRFKDDEEKRAVNETGVLGIASELFGCDSDIVDLKRALLGRILIVEDLETARRLAKKYNFRLHMVTTDGQIVRPGGSMTGGSLKRRENTFFGRKREIAALYEKEKEKEKEAASLEEARKRAEAEQAALSDKVSDIREKRQWLEANLAADAARHEALLRDAKAAEARVSSVSEEKKRTETQLTETEARIAELAAALAEMKDIEVAMPEEQREAQEALEAAASRVTALSVAKARAEEALLRAREICDDRETERLELVSSIENTEKQIAQKKEEETAGTAQLAALQAQFEKAAAAREAASAERDALSGGQNEALAAKSENDTSRREAEAALLAAERALAERTLRLEDETRRAEEEAGKLRLMGLTEEAAESLRKPGSAKEIAAAVSKLDADIEALGPVNPNAEAEYELACERLKNYEVQLSDLQKAAEGLSKIIEGIDAAMAKEFTEAFDKINTEFARIMGIMFPGGRGKLELTEAETPLEAGVELYLDLPGKKRQPLSLMSGGERALTVIALLISFLAFRPAPFCFVDEIDAALDDANVERFSRLMEEYKKRSQFIVITHRKKTMEFADTLQGVTMGEKGVSSLVTVRMEDYVK